LCVGTLQPRKNILRLIEAFEQVAQSADQDNEAQKGRGSYLKSKMSRQSELQLVLAGKVGWLAKDITARIAGSPVRQRIIVTGFVTEVEKAVLYQESVASILVGLYEGYGMPAIEALQYGSLPIVSETTSLPEVVGEAGIFVDPHSVGSIAEGIRTVLNLPARQRAQYLRAGRQQIKIRSWQHSANIVLQTLLTVGTSQS
jgi:glycosyltransferase involved in cell wall biosynthesis